MTMESTTQATGRVLRSEIGEMDALKRQVAELQARLAAKQAKAMTLKVTVPREKEDGTMTKGGAISLYGLGRFPVTLYRGQWERLLGAKEDVLAFIEANAGSLSVKE